MSITHSHARSLIATFSDGTECLADDDRSADVANALLAIAVRTQVAKAGFPSMAPCGASPQSLIIHIPNH